MSTRNLQQGNCAQCEGRVDHVSPPRFITKEDAGAYFDWYRGQRLVVADAVCIDCGAKYLAWISSGVRSEPGFEGPGYHYDLSYRKSFSDRPDPKDMPTVHLVIARARRVMREAQEYEQLVLRGEPMGDLARRCTRDIAIQIAEEWMAVAEKLPR